MGTGDLPILPGGLHAVPVLETENEHVRREKIRRVVILGIGPLLLTLVLPGLFPDLPVRQAQEDIQAGRYSQAEKDLLQAVGEGTVEWKRKIRRLFF